MLKKLLSITQLPGFFIVQKAALLGFVQTSLTFTNHWNSGEFVPNFTLPHTSTWDKDHTDKTGSRPSSSNRLNRSEKTVWQFFPEVRSLKLSWSSGCYQNYTNGPFLLGVETDFRLKFSAIEKANFSPSVSPRLCEKMILHDYPSYSESCQFISKWWQLKYVWNCHPDPWGKKWSNLTSIFFKGVGSTTN